MNKRKALAGAAAVTVTAVAGAFAVGAAFGMVGFSDASSKTGRLSPATQLVKPASAAEPTPIIETVVVDVPAPRPEASVQEPVNPSMDAATVAEDDPDAAFATDPSEPTSSPDVEGNDDDAVEHEDSHADEDDPRATDDHANEDTHEDEDD